MNIEKYRVENFEGHQKIRLSEELSKDVLNEIQNELLMKLTDIVGSLNSVGHDLKQYGDILPGDVGYRDDGVDEGGAYKCRLRLGVDIVVSVGFDDVIDDT